MPTSSRWNPREHAVLVVFVCKWILLAAPTGAIVGVTVALFLWALDQVTQIRWRTDSAGGIPWLLFLLPASGALVGLMYSRFGKSVEGGNNLIIDQIHKPGGGVPLRMAPLVLIGTVFTHLFGGSAGREGTAVQMGGSLASGVCRLLRLKEPDVRLLLTAGMAAGFGAVFGTPLTGTIFAVEVLVIGRIQFRAIWPCLVAAIVADRTTLACGIRHTVYSIPSLAPSLSPAFTWGMLGKVALAALAFGLASVIFAELTHSLGRLFRKLIPSAIVRPMVGGLLVIVLALLIGPDYLGLGVSAPNHPPFEITIVSAFHPGGATAFAWWWKILFTAVTLASGFKGGEVTPLFFVGATLGQTLARLLNAPVDVFAALGFVAVFAGATNTPLACTVMGIELFCGGGAESVHSGFVIYLAAACFLSYQISGHGGIYTGQRVAEHKMYWLEPSKPVGESGP